MSNLKFIAEQRGRKPWLIWVFILVLILLVVAGIFIWNFLSGGASQPAADLSQQMFEDTSLPI